jgi:hypothetical protein
VSFKVIENDPSFPVQPDDIDTEQSFHWAFPDLVDGPEAHEAAKVVIRLCQRAGGWVSFGLVIPGDPTFAGLVEPGYVWKAGERVPITAGWIVPGEDGQYRVTSDFIMRCYGRAGRSTRRP